MSGNFQRRHTETWLSLSPVNSRAHPVAAAPLELHPGELGHQVALGRPDVAEVAGAVPDAAVGLVRVVVRRALLGRQVVGVETDVVLARRGRAPPAWPGGNRRMPGTPSSTTNRPPGARWRAALRKHATCSAWVRRFPMLFQTDVDERELAGHAGRGHVADHHGDVGPLPVQLVGHRLRQLDPADRARHGRASGAATRPVPIASSRAAPSPASPARNDTAGSSTCGVNIKADDWS